MFFAQGGFQKTFHYTIPPSAWESCFPFAAPLKDCIGEDVVSVLARILSRGFKGIQKSGMLRQPTTGTTPEHAETFNFEALANKFFDKTPLTARLINSLCSASQAGTDFLDLFLFAVAGDIAGEEDDSDNGDDEDADEDD